MGTRLRSLAASPTVRRIALALAAVVAIIIVLESASAFRQIQLAQVAYLAIAAGGLTVLTGLNGQLSLGHGAFMAMGAYGVALLLEHQNLPVLLMLAIATLVAAVIGVIVGAAAARLHGPYLAGATLALAVAVPGIALHFSSVFGGEQGIRVQPPEVPRWADDGLFLITGTETSRSEWLAYLAWALLVLTYLLLANLGASRVGRRWRAVRDDSVAAQLAGIDVGRARVSAFVVSAACAGLAGGLMAMVTRIVAPSGFSLTLSLTLLSAVVLGGLGSLTGALLGATLLTLLPSLVTNVGVDVGLSDVQAAELAPLAIGLLTMVVIVFAPRGLVGSLRSLFRRMPRRNGAVPRTTSSTPATPTRPSGGTS